MLKNDKNQIVNDLKTEIEKSVAVLFVDFTGLTVAGVDKFRRQLRAAKVGYRVVKNTLMVRALEEAGRKGAESFLQGTPTGVVFGSDDPVLAAKTAFDFSKENDKLKIKGGILEKTVLSAQQTVELAKSPGRVQLQGMVVAAAMSPAQNVIGSMKSAGQKIAGIISKRVKDLEGSGN